MTSDIALGLAIVAGVVAILYGALAARWIVAQPAGNARMQEIAAAIQAGAQAYLNRQYSTIAVAGVVLLVVLAWLLNCLLYTSPSPRDRTRSRMPSSA